MVWKWQVASDGESCSLPPHPWVIQAPSQSQNLHSHCLLPTSRRAQGCVTTALLDSLLIHGNEASEKPHSQLQAEPRPPHSASGTSRLFSVITELVNRNSTVLGEFSRPCLISQFQRAHVRNKLNLHKSCCEIKRKVTNVAEVQARYHFKCQKH